jgi:hypothetical protein
VGAGLLTAVAFTLVLLRRRELTERDDWCTPRVHLDGAARQGSVTFKPVQTDPFPVCYRGIERDPIARSLRGLMGHMLLDTV